MHSLQAYGTVPHALEPGLLRVGGGTLKTGTIVLRPEEVAGAECWAGDTEEVA